MRLALRVLALLLLWGVCAAAAIPVGTGKELINALESLQPSGGAVELQTDVFLSESDLEGAALPIQVLSGTTMNLSGGGDHGAVPTLPLAARPQPGGGTLLSLVLGRPIMPHSSKLPTACTHCSFHAQA